MTSACTPCDPRWFDAGTRAIMFQITLYNTNTRELTSLRLLVEVFQSSFVLPSYQFDTAKVVVYQSKTDQVGTPVSALGAPALHLLCPVRGWVGTGLVNCCRTGYCVYGDMCWWSSRGRLCGMPGVDHLLALPCALFVFEILTHPISSSACWAKWSWLSSSCTTSRRRSAPPKTTA